MQRFFPARLYYGWVMVASAFTINTVVSPLNAVVFSFLIGPMSEDLGVSRSALAWCLTLRLIASGLSGPMIGVLLDRHGARWLGAACGAIGGGTMIVLGATADSLWFVYLLFAISGLAGFGGPAGQLLTVVPLARWFVALRGRALSVATTGMPLGTVFFIPLTSALVAAIGWRATTVWFGAVVAGVVVLVSVLFVRRTPEDMGLHPDGASGPVTESDGPPTRAQLLATSRDWTVAEAMRTPAMWLILGSMAIAGASLTGTLVYRVDFWRSLGMSANLVGLGTALDPACVVFSALAFGVLAERVPVRYLGFIGLAGLSASIVPMVVSDGAAWTIVAHNAIWGIAAGGWITLNNMIWPNYFGRRYLGAIRGIVLPLSIITTSVGPPVYGYLLDILAPSQVWMISTGAFAAAAVLVLLARPPKAPAAAEAPHPAVVIGAPAA